MTFRRSFTQAILITSLLSASLVQAQVPPQGDLAPTGATLPTLPPAAATPPAAPFVMPMPEAPSAPPAADPSTLAPTTPTGLQISVPATGATTGNTDAPSPAAAKPAGKPFRVSMGESNTSLFFTNNQISAMRTALTQFESTRTSNTNAPVFVDAPLAPEKPKIQEPATYPVFYLSSIVYHTRADWSLWVSGHKITSGKNPSTSLKVVAISPDAASFVWTPAFPEALAARKQANLFANKDAVKNKLTVPSRYAYDPKTNEVSFTLRPNESFVAAYFDTFEGYLESPPLPPMPNAVADKDANGKPTAKGTPAANGKMTPDQAASETNSLFGSPTGSIQQSISDVTKRFKR